MRAEHRKELQTNALADAMGRLIQEVKSRPQSTSIAVWIIGVLAVVIVVVWYFAAGSSRSRSALWVQLERDSYISEPQEALANLERIAADSPKTIPGRTARFQEARLLLPQSLTMLSTTERTQGIKNLVRARALYNQLANETSDDPLLRQEALLGAAKAEETLIGIPNPEKSSENYGTVVRAIELYRKAAAIDADGYLGQQARTHAEQLEKDSVAIEKFYTELNKLASANTPPSTTPK